MAETKSSSFLENEGWYEGWKDGCLDIKVPFVGAELQRLKEIQQFYRSRNVGYTIVKVLAKREDVEKAKDDIKAQA